MQNFESVSGVCSPKNLLLVISKQAREYILKGSDDGV
jgi:hypothetical protein